MVVAHLVFRATIGYSESFREANVGADLAYLMGAITDLDYPHDSFVDWTVDGYGETPPPILEILKANFPSDHVVWEFILLEQEVLAESES